MLTSVKMAETLELSAMTTKAAIIKKLQWSVMLETKGKNTVSKKKKMIDEIKKNKMEILELKIQKPK